MNLYLNELAPWEQKQQYFKVQNISNSTREISSQLESISRNKKVEQIQTVDAVVASQEIISETIEKGFLQVSDKLDYLNLGIYEIKSTFEWGITEIIWNIQQTNNYLQKILDVLKTPLATEAKEYKDRGLYAFKNNWFDDALLELNKAKEINKYDFTVYFTIGLIYHFHIINKNNAIKNYELALKYAKPNSEYYYSNILLHIALAKSSIGKLSEAEKYTNEAINTIDGFAEALYQNAQYNAKLGFHSKAITNIDKAISLDRNYILKASNDYIFKETNLDLKPLFIQWKEREKKNASNVLQKYKNDYNHFKDFVERAADFYLYKGALLDLLNTIDAFLSKYEKMNQRFNRDSIYDYLYIVNSIIENDKLIDDIKTESLKFMTKVFRDGNYQYEPMKIISDLYSNEHSKRSSEIHSRIGFDTNIDFDIGGFISFIVAIAFFSFIIKLILWFWFPWDSPTFIIPFIIMTSIYVTIASILAYKEHKFQVNWKNEESLKLTPLHKEYYELIALLENLHKALKM